MAFVATVASESDVDRVVTVVYHLISDGRWNMSGQFVSRPIICEQVPITAITSSY